MILKLKRQFALNSLENFFRAASAREAKRTRRSREAIQAVVEDPSELYGKFPSPRYLAEYGTETGVKYVLFFDHGGHGTDELIAYADAKAFAQRLKDSLYPSLLNGIESEESNSLMGALNDSHNDSLNQLKVRFNSIIQTPLRQTSRTEEVVQLMIEKEQLEVAVMPEDRPYIVKWEHILSKIRKQQGT